MSDTTQDFFEHAREHSTIKAQIVSKYVQTWARVLSDFQRSQRRTPEVVFADLFSGPGVYSDGTPSTPMLVLKAAVTDVKLLDSLRTFFNDIDEENISKLRAAVDDLPGMEKLLYKPSLSVGQATFDLLRTFKLRSKVPKLYFLDQFGYKDVTFALIQMLMEEWAECIFFFNYRRVIAAIDNPVMEQHMLNVFGSATRLGALRQELHLLANPLLREQVVMSHLVAAMQEAGATFVTPFSFKVEDSHRSTHHLVFLSKNAKGYELMKGIMARQGTRSAEGMPYLSYVQNPTPQNFGLFDVDPLVELGDDLCATFQGQTVTLAEVFLQHSAKNNLLLTHYRETALRLEEERRILVNPAADKRPMMKGGRTMARTTRITFGIQ